MIWLRTSFHSFLRFIKLHLHLQLRTHIRTHSLPLFLTHTRTRTRRWIWDDIIRINIRENHITVARGVRGSRSRNHTGQFKYARWVRTFIRYSHSHSYSICRGGSVTVSKCMHVIKSYHMTCDVVYVSVCACASVLMSVCVCHMHTTLDHTTLQHTFLFIACIFIVILSIILIFFSLLLSSSLLTQ